MKKHLIAAAVSSVALLVFAYVGLLLLPKLPPAMIEDYFSETFTPEKSRNIFFYVQPIVLAFSLAWFWNRFKTSFRGNWILKGLELAFVYSLIATLPAMILSYSAINVTLPTISTWFAYCFFQSFIVGEISARIDP